MQRVTGIGGIFFKAQNPEALYVWYEKHLGIQRAPDGSGVSFPWVGVESESTSPGITIWSPFPHDTKYFGAGPQTCMINYRVADLGALLKALEAEGVEIDPHREDCEYGRFAWIVDPEGNRIELWQPPTKEI